MTKTKRIPNDRKSHLEHNLNEQQTSFCASMKLGNVPPKQSALYLFMVGSVKSKIMDLKKNCFSRIYVDWIAPCVMRCVVWVGLLRLQV